MGRLLNLIAAWRYKRYLRKRRDIPAKDTGYRTTDHGNDPRVMNRDEMERAARMGCAYDPTAWRRGISR